MKHFLLILLFVFCLGLAPQYASADIRQPDWTDYGLIAHGMGGINGKDYTNSLDAFDQSYNNGFRVFEVDLMLSKDGQLVARHDWWDYLQPSLPENEKNSILTDRQFLKYKIYDQFTPLDFKEIVQLMKRHPDMYLVTDTKETDPTLIRKQFKSMVKTVKKVDRRILDRIIPEIYNPEMYAIVNSIQPFKHQIYSIYQLDDSVEEIIKFASDHHFEVVAMETDQVTPEFLKGLDDEGILPYIFTCNDIDEIALYKNWGAKGIYTDFLTANDLPPDENAAPPV